MPQIIENLAEMADNSPSDYVYLPIADARKLVNMTVNLVAKIAEVGVPRKSKGSDYCLILKIVDRSCTAPAVAVNFFAKEKEKLPGVKSAGDFVCLHDVVVKVHGSDPYFLVKKTASSFAFYEGSIHMEPNPYCSSSSYHPTARTNELLEQLRTLPSEQLDDSGITTSLRLLKNIESGKFIDIICKVLHVSETPKGEWMLFVWDGTDVPPTPFYSNLDLEKEKPVPLFRESFLLSRETLCSFPCVGTVLRITSDRSFEDIKYLLECDHWVKFYNVYCNLKSEMWAGTMGSTSRYFLLSDEDGDVKYRERVYAERIASNIGRVPLSGFLGNPPITETGYKKVAYATLMDSLTNSQVAHRCKCVVRVVAACSWWFDDVGSVDRLYRVRVTLEDATARVHAYTTNEEGTTFFRGKMDPEALAGKLNRLLGSKEPEPEDSQPTSRNPPWIECCLMSYYLDSNDPWGSRRYKIFGTKLLI